MPQTESLQAEFRLLTGNFTSEIAKVVKSIEGVRTALQSVGSASSGLNQAVAALEKGAASTQRAKKETKEYSEILNAGLRAIRASAQAEETLAQAKNAGLAAMRAARASNIAEAEARALATRGIFQETAALQGKAAAIRAVNLEQQRQVRSILSGRQADVIQPRAPTGGIG